MFPGIARQERVRLIEIYKCGGGGGCDCAPGFITSGQLKIARFRTRPRNMALVFPDNAINCADVEVTGAGARVNRQTGNSNAARNAILRTNLSSELQSRSVHQRVQARSARVQRD